MVRLILLHLELRDALLLVIWGLLLRNPFKIRRRRLVVGAHLTDGSSLIRSALVT